MKLSEKIQEALREQQEINLSDPAVQKRLAAQWGYVPAGAQPAPNFADAYQGAMEEVAIWKKRALEAEDLNRKFIAEINGPTHMGEPVQNVPKEAIAKILTEVMNIAVANGADSRSMPDEYVEVAAWLCGIPAQPAPIEQDTSVRKAWARFSNELHRSPDAPYPGMSEAFEQHFSQSFTDRDWRAESGTWAAAWKAAKRHGAQPAPSVPDATWLPVPDKHPTFDPVDLQLADGSVLCGCVPQSDGDYWWEGPSGEVFIDPRYAPVTHWRLSAAPEAKP